MDVEVKCERLSLCYGCLSEDRKMYYISDEFLLMFSKLRNDGKDDRHEDLQLCWECVSFLKRIKKFQEKIKTAKSLLINFLKTCFIQNTTPKPPSLSALRITHIIKNNDNKPENKINEQLNLCKDLKTDYEIENKIIQEELTDIKLECNDNIKNEYNGSNNHDSDYHDSEYKFDDNDKPKKGHSIKSYKKYKAYATITKRTDIILDETKQISETVCLNQDEYENVLRKDNRNIQYIDMPYKCEDCQVGYLRKLDLLRHSSFCHSYKTPFPYKCKACKTIMTSAEHLEQHWTMKHTVMYKCVLCSEVFRSVSAVRKHVSKKHLKTYRCTDCWHVCGTFRDFVKHYKTSHERVTCDHCNMKFTKKKTLTSHMKDFHIPAYCNICNRTYSNHKTYKYHNRVTHPELGETRKELSYCVECDRQYPSVYKYHRHLQLSPRHTPQKKLRVPCPDCGKIFTRTNFMRNHYRFAHLKVTKHYCDQCDKYYTTGYGLRQHVERVHKKIAQPKNKICDICGRGFSTNKILTNHRRTHTGERPHKCKYCPAAFAQETSMKTHQKTQHKNYLETS